MSRDLAVTYQYDNNIIDIQTNNRIIFTLVYNPNNQTFDVLYATPKDGKTKTVIHFSNDIVKTVNMWITKKLKESHKENTQSKQGVVK